MMPIHETLEFVCGDIRSSNESERASLQKLGVSETALGNLFPQWVDENADVGVHSLMSIRNIAQCDWQENTLKFGLLTVGSCLNGDPIAIDVLAGPPWPVYYISHEHEGLYDGSDLTRIKVADDFEVFLIECDSDEDFPYDYFQAKDRLEGDC